MNNLTVCWGEAANSSNHLTLQPPSPEGEEGFNALIYNDLPFFPPWRDKLLRRRGRGMRWLFNEGGRILDYFATAISLALAPQKK